METPEKDNKKYIPWIILICVLVIGTSLFYNRNAKLEKYIVDAKKSAAKNGALAQEYKTQSEISNNDAKKYGQSRDSVQRLLNKKTKLYENLLIEYNEKIKFIDSFTVSDMQLYWNNRYRPAE